jgi:UDP-N-acetylmuramoyl-L-alanyl-D-glutamate--2,6-diaminopimelate ligase
MTPPSTRDATHHDRRKEAPMTTLPFPTRSRQANILAVSLRRALPDAEFRGCPDLMVSGLSADAGRTGPGQVFVLPNTLEDDARDLATLAVERGASGVVTGRFLEGVDGPQVIVSDTRSAFARIAHAVAGEPSLWLPVIGLTGSGDTSDAATFVRAIFEANGRRVETLPDPGERPLEARDVAYVAARLTLMVDRRLDLAVVIVSPEALAERVADGLVLDAALICSGRTSDQPRGGDSRSATCGMSRMTRLVRPGGAVAIEAGDGDERLLAGSNLSAQVVTYGLDGLGDVTAFVEDRDHEGTRIRLVGLDRERTVRLQVVGEAALLAAVGAAAIARDHGASDGAIVAGLESVSRGRRLMNNVRASGRAVRRSA